jgi:hypothetical protein
VKQIIGGNFAQVPHEGELLLQLGWVEFLNGWVSFHFACGCVRT